MYNSIDIAENIKNIAKIKKISVKSMLADLELGVNTLQNMKTSMPKSDTLAKIADYLECSVDYLLGRTDNLNVNQSNNNGNIVNGNNGNNSPLTVNSDNSNDNDTIKQNFIALFDNLSPENQIEVMYFTKQLMKKED